MFMLIELYVLVKAMDNHWLQKPITHFTHIYLIDFSLPCGTRVFSQMTHSSVRG